ncbi:YdbL family protein [Candidatus Phycosocius spiralis]|nr:YdbL family protein [Candidatus Phycosocius spiralis]
MRSQIFAALCGVSILIATSVSALDNNGPIDQAIAAGIVGEQADGYLGFVHTPTEAQADLQRRINEVNIRRRAVYSETAKLYGETEDRVALLSALRQIAKADPGSYFQDLDKNWCPKGPSSQILQNGEDEIVIKCGPDQKVN